MKTVTAVEWLVQEIEKLYIGNFNITFLKQIEQAKEMEKQQIVDAYIEGKFDSDKIVMSNKFYAEQYYKETFE